MCRVCFIHICYFYSIFWFCFFFFFSSRRRHTRFDCDWSSDVCSSDLDTTTRLKRVESESQSAEEVIRAYAPSVCLIHVSVAFVDRASGRPLRYGGINPDGEPLHDSDGNPVYTLEGRAPEVRADFFGTGFMAGEGRILTNHHVAQPWWKNDELTAVTSQGLNPSIADLTAYFPDATAGVPASISDISEHAHLALVKGDLSGLKQPIFKMDARKGAAGSAQPLLTPG